MNLRASRLSHYGGKIDWLDALAASTTYKLAVRYSSAEHIGLASTAVTSIERFDVHDDFEATREWLRSRLNCRTVTVVFGIGEVCRLEASFFVQEWEKILAPGSDDAIILLSDERGILSYSQDDVLEFGARALKG
jgi:hypothetical protein